MLVTAHHRSPRCMACVLSLTQSLSPACAERLLKVSESRNSCGSVWTSAGDNSTALGFNLS